MSQSSSSMAETGEINYFFQDENGKIHKIIKQEEIKKEPSESSTVYSRTSAKSCIMGAYKQVTTSKQQFIKLDSNYNRQQPENSIYTVIKPQTSNMEQQQHNSSVASTSESFSDSHLASTTTLDERFTKYTQYSPKQKSKLHSTISSPSSIASSVQKKRKPEKAGKGLRHFSMKVCEKVKEKGITTYNEVADELVTEELQLNAFDTSNCDQKNIRRRVYDALNVLMAMQIITKDKKEIRWIGLPTNSVEQCSAMEKENDERRERIKQKHQQLRELLLQLVSFKSLIERNKETERQGIIPPPNSSIQLPFIIVNTHKLTKINCSVTNDKSEYIFKFDDKFEMHDDAEVLKRMGLLLGLEKGKCSYDDIERAKTLVPPNFEKYIEAYGKGKGSVTYDSDDDVPSYIELTNHSQEFFPIEETGRTSDFDDDDYIMENSNLD